MKMQNVEMEFVTFDAQDVIMTSNPTGGGVKSAMFTVSGDLLPGYTYSGDGCWELGEDEMRLYLDGFVVKDNVSYVITSDTTSSGEVDTISGGELALFNVKEGTATENLSTLVAIYEWIVKNKQ